MKSAPSSTSGHGSRRAEGSETNAELDPTAPGSHRIKETSQITGEKIVSLGVVAVTGEVHGKR